MARHKAPKGGFQPSQRQLDLEGQLRKRMPAVLMAERDAHRFTQEHLAERAGIHVTTIGKIERGQQVPSLALFVMLAQALDCEPTELLAKVLPGRASATYEDRAIELVRGFPAADRARLVPVLEAFVDLKKRT